METSDCVISCSLQVEMIFFQLILPHNMWLSQKINTGLEFLYVVCGE